MPSIRLHSILLVFLFVGQGAASAQHVDTTWLDAQERVCDEAQGLIYRIAHFDKNKALKGKVVAYYKHNNAIRFKAEMRDAQQGLMEDGHVVRYHPNGQKKEEYDAVLGNWDGPYQQWHDNGQLASKGVFDNDPLTNRIGDWMHWYPNGNVSNLGKYREGKKNGFHEQWYDDGKPLSREFFAEGEQQGLAQYWDKEGALHLLAGEKGGMRLEDVLADESDSTKYGDDIVITEHPWATIFEQRAYERIFLKEGKNDFTTRDGRRIVCHVKDNLMHGEYSLFDRYGVQQYTGFFTENARSGLWTSFDKEDRLTMRAQFQAGLLHGRFQNFKVGVMWEDFQYKEGRKHGKCEGYSKQNVWGETDYFIENYENGKQEGAFQWFYVDSATLNVLNLSVEGRFEHSEREGDYKRYHPNGKVSLTCRFENGLKHGEVVEYYPNGQKMLSYECKKGVHNSGISSWHPNGKPKTFSVVRDDELILVSASDTNGTSIMKDLSTKLYQMEHGKLLINHYINGHLTLIETYHHDGYILLKTHVKGEFISTNMLQSATFNTHVIPNGVAVMYFKNGDKRQETQYLNGVENGAVTSYYPGGKRKRQTEYKAGTRHGKEQQWYENGQLMSELIYENGRTTGEAPYYSPEGKLEGKVIYFNGKKIDHIRY
jgi:antitoxin component YwqK of YwqJK toxin-antitoxin module